MPWCAKWAAAGMEGTRAAPDGLTDAGLRAIGRVAARCPGEVQQQARADKGPQGLLLGRGERRYRSAVSARKI